MPGGQVQHVGRSQARLLLGRRATGGTAAAETRHGAGVGCDPRLRIWSHRLRRCRVPLHAGQNRGHGGLLAGATGSALLIADRCVDGWIWHVVSSEISLIDRSKLGGGCKKFKMPVGNGRDECRRLFTPFRSIFARAGGGLRAPAACLSGALVLCSRYSSHVM